MNFKHLVPLTALLLAPLAVLHAADSPAISDTAMSAVTVRRR